MSTSAICFIFIIQISNIHSLFYQSLCFPQREHVNATDILSSSYVAAIQNASTETQISELFQCVPTQLAPAYDEFHDCFLCIFELTETETELNRYLTLYAINEQIDTIKNEFASQLAYITFVSADHIDVDPRCENVSYPKICRFDLAAHTLATNGVDSFDSPYYLTFAMNNETKILQYEISYDKADNWFGIGFGEVGMNGDAAIYTCGRLNCATPEIHDYYLDFEGEQGVNADIERSPRGSEDFYDYVTGFVDGEFVISFKRAFDTGDMWDLIFDGNEINVSIFGAVGNEDTVIGYHAYVVPSVLVHFIPKSQQELDETWCVNMVEDDCIIVVQPDIPTNDPSVDPTVAPSRNPTESPTKVPSKNPSKNPSAKPTKSPVEQIIIKKDTETPQNAVNKFRVLLVFMVVIAMICIQ